MTMVPVGHLAELGWAIAAASWTTSAITATTTR